MSCHTVRRAANMVWIFLIFNFLDFSNTKTIEPTTTVIVCVILYKIELLYQSTCLKKNLNASKSSYEKFMWDHWL